MWYVHMRDACDAPDGAGDVVTGALGPYSTRAEARKVAESLLRNGRAGSTEVLRVETRCFLETTVVHRSAALDDAKKSS